MGIAEILVLLALGLFAGILSTVFDILAVGAASFLGHVALWVLLNALLAAMLESRLQACLWSIPFNLGWIEAYFITTSASYEGFARSLVVPLTAVAFLSPFLVYALWTAKTEKNAFGVGLSLFLVIGTLAASYLISGGFTIYNVVTSCLVAFVLLVLPVRRFRLTRKPLVAAQNALDSAAELADAPRRGLRHAIGRAKGASRTGEEGPRGSQADTHSTDGAQDEVAGDRRGTRGARRTSRDERKPAPSQRVAKERKPAKRTKRSAKKAQGTDGTETRTETRTKARATAREDARPTRQGPKRTAEVQNEAAKPERKAPRRPTKRKGGEGSREVKRLTARERRAEKEREAREREERRRAAARRRERDAQASSAAQTDEYDGYVSRLGTSRTGRPSSRDR